MFSKLSRVSNLAPQSARDAMSLEVADRSLQYDKLSRGGATSFESLGQHYPTSSDEVATLNKISTKNAGFSNHSPPSPGAPAGDHHRHPTTVKHSKKNGRNRNNRNLTQPESNQRTNLNNTTTDNGGYLPENPSTERGIRHSAPSSSENTQRKPDSSATKRTASAKEERNEETTGTASRYPSPSVKNHRHNVKGVTSPTTNTNKKFANRNKSGNANGLNELSIEGGIKALSSSELIVARKSARDSQRQMRQKAKLAIAMWKERMTKKRESSTQRLATCNGCFPPLTDSEEVSARDSSVGRKGVEADTGAMSPTPGKPIPRHDCQIPTSGSPKQLQKVQTPQQQQQQQRPGNSRNPGVKMAAMPEEEIRLQAIRSPTISPEVGDEGRLDIVESPIPRSSPDDLSATDVSTKAASSSQHSTQQLSTNPKRNSASSRENQRSKIPRPVDGQGDKVKKNDSVETTSILSSSSEKEVTSHENLLAMLPDDLILPRTQTSPSSPLLNVPSSSMAQDFTPIQQQPAYLSQQYQQHHQQSYSQQLRPVVEPSREKRRRRGGHRLLHSTDDDEDDWPDSPSTAGSPPIIPPRSKPRTRHQTRRSPKPPSPPLLMGKRSSGGDADLADKDGSPPPGFCSGPDSDAQSSAAVIMPRRKPYLQRKMVEIKFGGMTSEMRDHLIRKRQRQEIYALNQVMTALEFAQFEHFCRTRNIPLSV